jgi:zinc D-Ala-D-Ala carboxypeptidase
LTGLARACLPVGVNLTRRSLLIMPLALPMALAWRAASAQSDVGIREWVRAGVERDSSGSVTAVFGLDPDVWREVLLPATRADALPDGYAPGDLASAAANGIPSAGRQLVRTLIVDDTRALVEAAARDGQQLYVGSGFRSQAYQVDVFAAQVARWGDEEIANRYSARPGHSQHQLGTTIDFTNDFRTFRTSDGPAWLRANAHRFGFVLPYTAAASGRTGYVDEPWHARWVGRPLASRLQLAGYQDWTDLNADDVVASVQTEATT